MKTGEKTYGGRKANGKDSWSTEAKKLLGDVNEETKKTKEGLTREKRGRLGPKTL